MQCRKVVVVLISSIFASQLSAQTLQCQIEKEALIKEHQRDQEMRNFDCSRMPTPEQQASCNMNRAGYMLGGGLAQTMGAKPLEVRIKEWEERCGQRNQR